MKKRDRYFSIKFKLWLGFGSVLGIVFFVSIIIYSSLNKNIYQNRQVLTVNYPSSIAISKLEMLVTNSLMYIKSWVFTDKQENTPDKIKLKKLLQTDYPSLKQELLQISKKWVPTEKDSLMNILSLLEDTLFPKYRQIMQSLNSFESYDDPMIMFEIQPMVENGGEVLNTASKALEAIQQLKTKIQKNADQAANNMQTSLQDLKSLLLVLGVIITFLTLLISFVIIRSIVHPVNNIKNLTLKIAKGVLPDEEIKIKNKDEIGEMVKAFNQLIKSLRDKMSFAREIGKGNLNVDFSPASEQDVLGYSLVEMRNSLKKAAEVEQERKKEEEQKKWFASGLAHFGEILRHYGDDEKATYDKVITELVHYIRVEQGALLVLNDEDEHQPYLEILSTYAYDRLKYYEGKIPLGEGIAGEVALEGQSIYLSDLPEDFANITSGLGQAKPRYLLVVPLKLEEDTYGVIELASFHEIPAYKRDFVEKLAENIAAAMKNIKINQKTQALLAQFQEQSEEMRAQEEELKQNLEELKATQEDLILKEKELNTLTDAIEQNLLKIELDNEFKILKANEVAQKLSGKTEKELIGKYMEEITVTRLNDIWQKTGQNTVQTTRLIFKNEHGTEEVAVAFIPFVAANGSLQKVLVLGIADQTDPVA